MILVFGTICIDRVRRIPGLPQPGGYVEVAEEHLWLGGEAANTALFLKTWDQDVILYGNPLGRGEDAECLGGLLEEHGLDGKLRSPRVVDGSSRTPICDIYVTPDGDRTMFGAGFSDIVKFISLEGMPVYAGEWFTADPNMRPVVENAIEAASQASMRCYLMDFFQDHDPILPGMYWQSSTDWVGQRGDVQANLDWVRRWVEAKGCFTVLTDGPHGIFAGGPDLITSHYRAFPAPAVVDSTGAGDIFRAAMLLGLGSGRRFAECLRFASAAGSLKCQGSGATGYVPSQDEILAHIRSHPAEAAQYEQ